MKCRQQASDQLGALCAMWQCVGAIFGWQMRKIFNKYAECSYQPTCNVQHTIYGILYCASRGWDGAVSGLSAVTLWSVWHAALNSCWRWCMSNSMPLYAHAHIPTYTHTSIFLISGRAYLHFHALVCVACNQLWQLHHCARQLYRAW